MTTKLHSGFLNFLDDALSDGTDASSSRLFAAIAIGVSVLVVLLPFLAFCWRMMSAPSIPDYPASLLAAQSALCGTLLGPTLLAQYGTKREESKEGKPTQ